MYIYETYPDGFSNCVCVIPDDGNCPTLEEKQTEENQEISAYNAMCNRECDTLYLGE